MGSPKVATTSLVFGVADFGRMLRWEAEVEGGKQDLDIRGGLGSADQQKLPTIGGGDRDIEYLVDRFIKTFTDLVCGDTV